LRDSTASRRAAAFMPVSLVIKLLLSCCVFPSARRVRSLLHRIASPLCRERLVYLRKKVADITPKRKDNYDGDSPPHARALTVIAVELMPMAGRNSLALCFW
jgi:uncharacterized protein YbaR (Trm112 family)